MKVCEICESPIDGHRDGDNRCDKLSCQNAPDVEHEETPKPKRKRRKSATQEVMESLGLTRVRGALGGVYYE